MPEFASFDEAWRWFEREGEIVVADDTWADSWAHGRAQYLAFIARVEEPAIIDAVERTRQRLAPVAGVVPFTDDYLHVTLAGVGFQVLRPSRPDELTREQAMALGERVAPLFQRSAPVTFSLGAPNVLGEAIVLELHDEGRWEALRRSASELAGRPFAGHALPHLSLARCVERPDRALLLATLRALRSEPLRIAFTVRRIELARAWLIGDFPREEPELKALRRYGLRG